MKCTRFVASKMDKKTININSKFLVSPKWFKPRKVGRPHLVQKEEKDIDICPKKISLDAFERLTSVTSLDFDSSTIAEMCSTQLSLPEEENNHPSGILHGANDSTIKIEVNQY